MGFSIKPLPSYKFWIILSVSLFVFSVLSLCVYRLFLTYTDTTSNQAPLPTEFLFRQLRYYALEIPLLEEAIYRGVFCVCLRSVFGFKTTIIVSGILFALLHFIYRNPGIDNILGGFFLSWAFLISKSLLVPFLFHSVGNSLYLFFIAVN
ncbi:CPBP family intramembrane metalloprotease [candidate division WOR-3 bacterium]|nr:CPBP family intramembrane metalloprotease [candidate division WOR-3 bacterium]